MQSELRPRTRDAYEQALRVHILPRLGRLKIAQELVLDVTGKLRNATVVRAAIRLADELGIECIAEGIETPEQADFLIEAGCSQGQGFLFSRPVEASIMTAMLRERRDAPPRKPQRLSLAG